MGVGRRDEGRDRCDCEARAGQGWEVLGGVFCVFFFWRMRGSWSLCHQSTMAAMPVTRSSGLGVGDTRMRDMYSEYAGI